MTFDQYQRALLAELADVLIPAEGNMPSASEADVAHRGLDGVLRARPDLADRLHDLLRKTEPGTPAWLRKAFTLNNPIQKATLYTSARGLVELYMNGRRIGNDIFMPEWTDYDKRIHYRTYDVTEMIQ